MKEWIKKISGLTSDIIRDVRACYKSYGKNGKSMPSDVRVRCRVLIFSAIYWETFAIYSPVRIGCDMYEVLIESDLTVFVCPCGNQFSEEQNLYHHVRLVHKDVVFKPL